MKKESPYEHEHDGQQSWLGLAVLYATINNDCETLEEIANWANKENVVEENPSEDAMLLACLKDNSQCIKHLYQLNYRIHLHENDETRIQNLMNMKKFRSKAMMQNQRSFTDISQTSENIESGIDENASKSVEKEKERNKKSRRTFKFKDKVERYLSLKAYANPHYLIAEFHHELKESANNSSECCPDDPLRKSLAIGSYAGALSKYSTLFTQEFQDISKVSEASRKA